MCQLCPKIGSHYNLFLTDEEGLKTDWKICKPCADVLLEWLYTKRNKNIKSQSKYPKL